MLAKIPAAAGDRRSERRSPRPPDHLPIDELHRMPALVALERLPVPALAVDRPGTILFANGAFCEMVGYSPDELLSINFDDIFHRLPADDGWVALVGTGAKRLVELRNKGGHSVWANMSKSAMRRRDDTVALVTFQDRTEELWLTTTAEVTMLAGSPSSPIGRDGARRYPAPADRSWPA
jgi:PAS domain S-box-containing protein